MKKSLLLIAIAFVWARPADAATIVRFDPCVGSCLARAAATVTIDAGVANINLFGRVFGDDAIGFNLAGSDDGLLISVLTPGYSLSEFSEPTNPYFGSFDYYIAGPGAPPTTLTPSVQFTISRAGGFLSPLDVLAVNELGYFAAVHFGYLNSFPDYQAANSIETILPPAVVPEPGSMILLGTGLVACWRTHRRRLLEQRG